MSNYEDNYLFDCTDINDNRKTTLMLFTRHQDYEQLIKAESLLANLVLVCGRSKEQFSETKVLIISPDRDHN